MTVILDVGEAFVLWVSPILLWVILCLCLMVLPVGVEVSSVGGLVRACLTLILLWWLLLLWLVLSALQVAFIVCLSRGGVVTLIAMK